MGDIGPQQQHYEVLPARPSRYEPGQPEPARPAEPLDAERRPTRLAHRD